MISGSIEAADIQLSSLRIEGVTDGGVTLSGPDSSWQFVITGEAKDTPVDVIDQAKFEATPAGVVSISASGLVTPNADGNTTVTARVGGLSTKTTVTVSNFAKPGPVSFITDVAPVFTRNSCNSGGCHGKKGGQEGFELALLGFEPKLDLERVTDRVDVDDPDASYLLRKATKAEPHAGGQRFKKGSPAYNLLRRWIAQGAKPPSSDEPTVERIEVFPKQRVLNREAKQRLLVVAHLTDGSLRDVSRLSRFESNQEELLSASEDGLVTAERSGVAAVMVRYQAHVGVFRAIVPTGEQIDSQPEPLNFIDRLVFDQHRRLGIATSLDCDDATFIRRATIDIAGRLPTLDEVSEFVEDSHAKKHSQLIDRLLESEDHADYFAGKWAAMLHNRRGSEKDPREPTQAFHQWIREVIRENRPYDEMVRGVLTATGQETKSPPVLWYRMANEPSTQLEDVSQLFLGQRIQCARCHHHPFEKWSEADYYGMAAFFSRLKVDDPPKGKKQKTKPPLNVAFRPGKAEAKHPKTEKPVPATPLEASPISIDEKTDPRVALVDWMTSKDNRFFARVFVNRYWKHFLGRGLVEPEDDLRATNPPTNPELLDALARHFVEANFDMREMIRVICSSRTYRLSSQPAGNNESDEQNYSRFLPRRLNAEVLLDSIDRLTLTKTKFSGVSGETRATQLPDNRNGSYFLSTFGRPAGMTVCECERRGSASLAQLLLMINSPEMLDKVAGERAKQLASDKRPHEDRIAELYQLALARPPRDGELTALMAYFKSRGILDEPKTESDEPEKKTEPAQPEPESTKQKDVRIVSIAGSGHDPKRAFDGDRGTRWTINGYPHWVQFELSAPATVSEIRVGFTKGTRNYRFDLAHSSDGNKWKTIKEFTSSGKGDDVESFLFKPTTSGRFRLIHQGNNQNNWANIHTIELPGIAVSDKPAMIDVKAAKSKGSPNGDSLEPKTLEASHQAYADLIWALINTKEFQFNH